MTTAGEAASLFGGADSANDPFALAIQEEPQVSGHDPFASLGPSSPAADLFDSATTEGTAFLAEQEYVPQQITAEAPNGTWSAPNSHTYAPAEHYGYGQQEAYSAQPAANGWHDNQGQWANGSQAQYNTVNGNVVR
ncbi:hypothetical protein BDW22DRAFT_255764 [Trametopsis cervina]|nr:hypothetical protein BDW22DRAFT_255764 [Trametopsis cervina]